MDWKRYTIATGKTRPTATEQVLHAHRRTQEKRRKTRRRESGSTESVDPLAAHLGIEGLEAEEGDAQEGLARRTLAAAEHARRSTPESKWSAECEKNALSTDAPEGVVGEIKVEVRVQPFSCSGPPYPRQRGI